MPNARDVEDWLNMENELPTSPQMSDEEILAIAVGDSTESESVCSDEEDEGEDEKLVSTKEAAQCFKKMLVVDGVTERYWPCAFNAAKTNDGLRNAIKL